MRNKAGIAFAAVGAVLLLSALLLFFHNRAEAAAAAREAETLVETLEQQIAAPTAAPEKFENTEPEASPAPDTGETAAPGASAAPTAEPPTASAETYVDTSSIDYLGILEIPALDVNLPVINTMSDALLEYGACRHFGSPETNDLVIAAHSYPQFFGYLGNLPGGSEVILTEMDGTVRRYTLTDMAKIAPDDAEAALNSGYDLVLYTCYDSGYGRVAAYFTRSE